MDLSNTLIGIAVTTKQFTGSWFWTTNEAKYLMNSKFVQKLLAVEPRYADIEHRDFYLIGELAGIVGLEPKTIRFYERAGLLSPERHGRMRIFKPTDLERLLLIKMLRKYEISLSNIRAVIFGNSDKDQGLNSDFAMETLLKQQLARMESRKNELSKYISSVSTVLGER
jgi:DNA-binding transcriptional MerR regulator